MKPSTLKTLALLKAFESVTTHDLLVGGCGSRYGARLRELRELGYVIDMVPLSDRSGASYRLISEPTKIPQAAAAHEGSRVDDGVHLAGCPGSSAPGPQLSLELAA